MSDSRPAYRIGIDLGGTKIEAVALADDGEVAFRRRVPTPNQYQGALATLIDLVREIEAQMGRGASVGVGTPGAWVPSSGAMKNCNSTWLNGRPLLHDLAAALGDRVRIANDANCLALSEALTGAARGAGVVFAVILGTGVGGGIVVDGRLLPGANAIAGEWGHTPMPFFRCDAATRTLEAPMADRPCYCGRDNCVETFLSGPGLALTHSALTGEAIPAERIPAAAPTLDLYTTMLARALAQVVNLLDPDALVLGGGVSNLDGLPEALAHKLPAYAFSHEGRTRILRAQHGDASGVFGACRLWPAASGLA